MRVLLVGPDHESNLSLLYLAASLRAAGHAPEIAAFNAWHDAPAVLRAARRADLVGLSMCFQLRAGEFLALAEALKREAPARPIVAGGHHASCAAVELLDACPALDVVVIHEGEETLVELANLGEALVARAADVRGVAVRGDGGAALTPPRAAVADLDRLPRPDRDGPARLLCGVPTAYLMGSRGCVSDCDYCCITTLHRLAPGPRFRQRSPEDVADEMADLYHRRGVRQFVFHDDNFLVPSAAHNRERIARIDAALAARGVKDVGLVLKCSPRDAARPALEALRRLGLLRLFMGVESGSACGLESIGRRRQGVGDSERALALCESLGISTQYTLIVFHPEATIESILADLAFAARHPAHPMNYCRAEIYAGTPLEARMRAAGRLEGTWLAPTYRYTDPRVATVWELGGPLFAGRCWGEDELLGSVIRLDHQVAVLGRFYDGRHVRRLVRSFLAWEAELNLETAGLFRELVVACGEASGAADPALLRAVADLRGRESRSRAARLRHLCEYRRELERYARASVRLGGRHAAAAASGRRLAGPRHAAAVAAAIGMLGCAPAHDHGVAEAAPPPYDPRPPPPPPPPPPPGDRRPAPDARAECAVIPTPPPPPVRHDGGVMEAPPPPYRNDVGVAEAAPPPYRHDGGVAEAAPPPYERPVARPPRVVFDVRTVPAVPVRDGLVQFPRPIVAGPGNVLSLPVGPRAEATLGLGRAGPQTTIQVSSDVPLRVTCGKASSPAPARVVLRDEMPAAARVLVLEDPATRARVEVHVGPARVTR
ncbi:MAG TPA: cobalamin-dependent protein [Anaeromyxobacter sp.]|nr:cobalamin-dependent protein [Anaeromyxobacter sp.]